MPNFKKNKSAFMMKGKSTVMKKLVGKQSNIDKNKDGKISEVDFDMMNNPITFASDGQRKAAYASGYKGKSPNKMYGKTPAKMYGKHKK